MAIEQSRMKGRGGGPLAHLVAGAAIALASALLLTFENAADLRFFGRVPFAMDLWLAMRAPPPTLLKLPCDQMAAVFDADRPILFEGCIPEGVGLESVGYFPDEAQNLFAPCDGKIQRDFEFVDETTNRSKAIVEQVPCSPSTLREKIAAFEAHDVDAHGNYFEVHTRMATESEKARLDAALHATMDVPEALSVSTRMTAPVVTHFFHAGRTAVYYLHAHMDRFLSFCLQEEKQWTLVAPQYFSHFDHRWSGNAEMMLREKTAAPRLEITQRRGDVLFVPPWWIHETRVKSGTKNFGVNIHWMSRGQILGYAASLHRILGNPAWFFSRHEAQPPAPRRGSRAAASATAALAASARLASARPSVKST